MRLCSLVPFIASFLLMFTSSGYAQATQEGAPEHPVAAAASSSDAQPDPSERILLNVDKDGLGIQGYDPVAYFTLGAPTKGSPKYKATYRRVTYHFASEEHRALFEQEPSKYAPAFGGYCGYAASINRLSPIDPRYYGIQDGRLILQRNAKALELYNENPEESLRKADGNWPSLEARNGATAGKTLVATSGRGVGAHGRDLITLHAGAPVRGKRDEFASYHGVLYLFESQKNRFQFEDNPTAYLPECGGYCVYAAALGKKARSNPKFHAVVGGRLCLFGSAKARDRFLANADRLLEMARQNYPSLVEKYGK